MRLIDAEKAINEAYDIVIDGERFQVVQVETLMGLPTIEAVPTDFHDKCMAVEIEKRMALEPKHGRWINKFVCSNNHIGLWCSECGKLFYNIPTEDGEYNYCPNCGASMMDEVEE